MLRTILIALAAIVAVLLLVVALQPGEFRVARTTTISAPPAIVFAQVNDLHTFQEFSPWAKRDPSAKMTFDGPPAGTGASFTWAGNSEVGEGRMTIIESHPNDHIGIKLQFLEPFTSTANADFAFKPEGDQTLVTWSMHGEKNFFAKALHLALDMDKMIGGDFEKGLADLRALAEARARARS